MPERLTIQDLLTHADWVRLLAQRLVRDANTADDLVQETWLAALKHPGTAVHAPRGWLHEVTRRFAWQSARRKQPLPMEPGELATRDTALEPDVIAERLELQQELTQAVLSLESSYRRLVFLRFYEGLTPKEIAAKEGLPVTTVSNRLSRALDQLRAALDEKHQGRSRWKALYIGVFGLGGAKATVITMGAAAALLLLVVAAGIYIATRPTESEIKKLHPREQAAPRVDAAPDPAAAEPELSVRGFSPLDASPDLRQGLVRDETGQPIEGARVLVHDEGASATLETRWHEDEPSTNSLEVATTDAAGRFQIRSDPGSALRLFVRAPGFGLGRITANSEEPTLCVLPQVARTCLRILDQAGRPVAQARVWVRPPLWLSTTALHPWLDILESDARGEALIDQLGGDLSDSVMATAVRWVDAQELPQSLVRVAAPGFAPSRPFRLADLEASADGARVLILEEAARGLVTFDASDAPPEAGKPRLWLREQGLVRSLVAPLTGPLPFSAGPESGRVEIASLSGALALAVTTPGARRLPSGAYELRGLAGDQLVAHARWVRAAPRRGRLLEAGSSTPLAGVDIGWRSVAEGASSIAGVTTSDARGEFVIAGHGGHGLRLWIQGGAVAADTLVGAMEDRPLTTGATGVVLLPATDAEEDAGFELRAASSAEVVCHLRLPTGDAVSGVTMRASLVRQGLEAFTLESISDQEGAVRLALPARRVPVILRAEDSRGFSFEHSLPSGEGTRDLGTFELTRDPPVDFLMVDDRNQPLPGVTIRVLDALAIRAALEATDRTLVSDANGRARLPFRGRGPARILAESRLPNGLSLSRRSASALPLEVSTPIVIRYETPHFIEADLRWEDGSPAAALSVWLAPESPHSADAELLADLAAAGGRELATFTEDEKQMLIGAHARTDAEGRLRVRVDDLRTYRPLRILRRDAGTSTAQPVSWPEGTRLRAGERPTILPVFPSRSGVPR